VQPRFAELEHPAAYTRVVLVNLTRRHVGREARRRNAEQRTVSTIVVSPEHRELLDVVGALPLRQRAVIVLRYYEGLSEAEIATALRCRQGTVKSLSARALERLRREIGGP
jgi:RNA polymerase sigma factor (sigma-70 family)